MKNTLINFTWKLSWTSTSYERSISFQRSRWESMKFWSLEVLANKRTIWLCMWYHQNNQHTFNITCVFSVDTVFARAEVPFIWKFQIHVVEILFSQLEWVSWHRETLNIAHEFCPMNLCGKWPVLCSWNYELAGIQIITTIIVSYHSLHVIMIRVFESVRDTEFFVCHIICYLQPVH